MFDYDDQRTRKLKPSSPDPRSLPFLESLSCLFSSQLHIQLSELSKNYGNIFKLQQGLQDSVVVNSYNMVREALVNQADIFSERPPYPLFQKINKCQGIVLNNGCSWRQNRRFTLHAMRNFGVGKRSMESRILEETNILQQAMKGTNGEPFDARHLIFNAASNIICSVVFGQRFEYTDKMFLQMLKLISKSLQLQGMAWTQLYNSFARVMDFLPGPHQEMFSCYKQICVFLREQIDSHLIDWDPTAPRDFIDSYLSEIGKRADDSEAGLHEEDLCYILLDLFVAGSETTSNTILWAFIYLMKHPEMQEYVQAEIDNVIGRSRQPNMADRPSMPYTDAVIHEVQRMANVVPLNMPRETNKDTILGGYFLSKGTSIIPNLTSVLFDPTQWKSPSSFNPQHFLNTRGEFVKPDAFIPFSAGRRVCPGEPLARMELFLFLTSLLQAFSIRPPAGSQLCTDYHLGITRSPKPFQITAIPR